MTLPVEKCTQKELGHKTGLHQSTISRLESDFQAASKEQLESLASSLGADIEQLTGKSAPSIHIETQTGGYANNYLIQHNMELLKAKDDIIAAKESVIALQQTLIRELEAKIEAMTHR